MACMILIFVGIDTSKHLNIFSKTLIVAVLSANVRLICSLFLLLVPLLLMVYPKRQKLSTTSVSSLTILRVLVHVVNLVVFLFNLSSIFFTVLFDLVPGLPDPLHFRRSG